jgi:hypothetical protein
VTAVDLNLFSAGPAAAAAEQPHPSWCDRSRCTDKPGVDIEDALHLSAPVELETALTPVGLEDVDAWLQQGAAGGEIYLVVHVVGTPIRAMYPIAAAIAGLRDLTRLLGQTLPTPHPTPSAPSVQEGDQA